MQKIAPDVSANDEEIKRKGPWRSSSGGGKEGTKGGGENFTTMIRECQGNLKEEKRREFNFSVIEG